MGHGVGASLEHSFTDIFDIPTLTRLCQRFTELRGSVIALLDLEGNVHVATGWKDICTKFHRACPGTSARCTESDTVLAGQLEEGQSYNLYKCRNGLVDVAVPVMIEGEHVGNFFTGQFLLEPPDVGHFRLQALQFGFDEDEYLAALDDVQVLDEEETRRTVNFLVELTQVIGEMGLERLRTLRTEELARRSLEEQVAARTRELQAAKEAAEVANRAKSIFLASMSHELRTPLNAILGFARLMDRDELFPDRHRRNLATVNRAGEHLLGMISDVLDMSKIESGQMQMEGSAFDLRRMLRELSAMSEVRAEGKGLRFLLEISPELPRYVVSDPGKVRQILINLLGNAVKYTDEGGAVLRATGSTKADGARWIQLEVEDSGRGIPQNRLARIFEPFVQTGSSKGEEGTGLGLAITDRLVDLLGGRIEVESRSGEGSVFRVHLPLVPASPEQARPTAPRRRAVGLAPGERTDWRLLGAEDNADNRDLLRAVLQNVGLDVREATNGAEAVELFERWRPHLIWMDNRMPVMDGCEAAERIRSLPGGDECRIIAVSASTFRDEVEELLAAGFDDYLRKPYRDGELYAMLERHLGIRFSYEEEAESGSRDGSPIGRDEFANLPAEWRDRFQAACQKGRVGELERLVAQLADDEPESAARLAPLVEDVDFERILELAGG
jgi:signal transduction histidine kinase/CheY-like chemotaxis protein